MRPCGRIMLVLCAFLTSFIVVSPLSGPIPAWSADYNRQPIQRMPGPQPVSQVKAPWQPIAPLAYSFEENYTQIQVLIRDIEAKTGIESTAQSVRDQASRMDKLRRILDDLRAELQEILKEVAVVSSLIREAAMADQSRTIVYNDEKQLVNRLETELSILENRRAQLANKINILQQELNTINDMDQLDRMNLQDAQQKLQQLYQTLSNIMKNQHDVLKAIINNMR